MNQSVFPSLSKLQKAHRRLGSTLESLADMGLYADSEACEQLATDAALQAESLACNLRDLLFITTSAKPEQYFAQAGGTHGIRIDVADGIFSVRLPRLLPKKHSRNSDPFLLDPLRYALDGYARAHSLPHFRICTVCFEHVYSRLDPHPPIRDYDNLQQKKLLDLVALYTMQDDSGSLCDVYYTTLLEDVPCTRVSVMEPARFSLWLRSRKGI